ncbi:hypothetical protein T12_8958, partial [Trichinella patagoniensis]
LMHNKNKNNKRLLATTKRIRSMSIPYHNTFPQFFRCLVDWGASGHGLIDVASEELHPALW